MNTTAAMGVVRRYVVPKVLVLEKPPDRLIYDACLSPIEALCG